MDKEKFLRSVAEITSTLSYAIIQFLISSVLVVLLVIFGHPLFAAFMGIEVGISIYRIVRHLKENK